MNTPTKESASPIIDRPKIADDVLSELRRIVQAVTMSSRDHFRTTGLTMPQALCLRAIGEAEPHEITATGVSRHVNLSPATVTGILDRLEKGGFIRRERHARDRRKVCLLITPKGRERLETMPAPLQDRFMRRFMTLPESERDTLLSNLRRLTRLLDATELEASPILVTGDLKADG